MERPQTEALTGDVGQAALSKYLEHPLTEGWRGFVRHNRNAIGALLRLIQFWMAERWRGQFVAAAPAAQRF